MKNALAFASLIAIAALVACGGGSTTAVPYTAPTSNSNPSGGSSTTTSNVSFYVIVPGGTQTTSKKRRPAFVAPNGTQSVAFTLTSVNGSAANGTPSVASLSGANASCTQGNNEVLCSFTVSAPVGTLIYTVDTYTSTDGSGTPTGEGVIQVVTTAGRTTVANTALGGTVTNLVVVLDGAAELGASAAIPVFVEALDANGYTILGNYTSPLNVTVNDSDSSATSVTNPTQTYTNSTSTSNIELNYSGAAMTAAATIGATATTGALPGTPIPAANITPASFLPDATAPTVNGAETSFAYTETVTEGYDGPPTSPEPTYTGNYTVTVATGQSFNGASNLVAISGLQEPTLGSPESYYYGDGYFDSNAVTYFAWTPQGNITSLGYVGVSDPSDVATNTCATPYSNQLELPFPSSWNVLAGAGSCTYSNPEIYGGAGTQTNVTNSDGSYSYIENITCCEYYSSATVQSNGSAILNCFEDDEYGETITVPAPLSGAANISVTYSQYLGPNATPDPNPTESPETVSVPNPWLAFATDGAPGLANGTPPNPLESDTFATPTPVPGGGPVVLPTPCAVPSTVLGASPTLSEMVETIVAADPLNVFSDSYSTLTVDHYYLDGVGEICNEQIGSAWYMPDGAYGWYANEEYDVADATFTAYTYVTQSSLTATYAHVHSFAQAVPATTRAFTAATYVLIHSHPQFHRRGSAHSQREQAALARFHRT